MGVYVSFQTPLDYEVLPNGRYRLLAPLAWDDGFIAITTTTGTVWNGPSVPRLLRWAMPDREGWLRESCIHDEAYRRQYDRRVADALLQVMVRERYGRWDAFKAWVGVRVGGWTRYVFNGDTR